MKCFYVLGTSAGTTKNSSWWPRSTPKPATRPKLQDTTCNLGLTKKCLGKQGPCITTRTTMTTVRGRKTTTRRQEDKETTTTVMVTVTTTCPCVCDNDHYYLQEDERQTKTGEMTGQREGATTTTMTRMTAITNMQDRFEDRYRRQKRTTTSFEGVIRVLMDRLDNEPYYNDSRECQEWQRLQL